MTLVSSGILYLAGSAGGTTRCIRYEILGSYGSYTLDTANTASGNSTWTMDSYYGYSAAVPIIPAKCLVGDLSGLGFIQAQWLCNAANDACQLRWRRNDTSFSSWTDRTSPYTLEGCVSNKTYYVEIRGRIGTTYSASCSPTYNSGSCSPI